MPDTMIAYCGPARCPGRTLDPLECGSAADCNTRCLGACGWSQPILRHPSGLGGDRADAVIFVSPLCALSSALFSVRVLHHVLLIAAVAPLLALAFPQRRAGSPPLVVLVAAHAVILWLWHTPGPYAWGLASVPAYWLMQISLLGSAWLLWRAILAPCAVRPGAGCTRSDDWADGPSRRVDRVRAQAALSRASGEHGSLGARAAH